MRLQQEGLLEALTNGGYAVKTFSERDVSEAIELRGTMEGLLARLAAERGAPPVALGEARKCLGEIDAFLAAPALSETAFSRYVSLNEKLHALLPRDGRQPGHLAAAGPGAQPALRVALGVRDRAGRVAAGARHAVVAQDQHWQALEAIEQHEGTRAEGVMREHSRITQRNLRQAVRNLDMRSLPGVQLIRRRG